MTNLRTQLIAISSLLLALPLQAQDNAKLINIMTLEELNAVRYDLNGDGIVSFTTPATLSGSPMFADRAEVVKLMDADGVYAQTFTTGTFYDAADATTAASGAVATETEYFYKLSSDATSPYVGYELMNDLDFDDTDGAGEKSKWSSLCTTGCETEDRDDGAGNMMPVNIGWAPIGDNTTNSASTRFMTTFEGNDHVISNLYINREAVVIGLFGIVGEDGEVRNLGLNGGSVEPEVAVYTGGLVGYSQGTITRCYTAEGNVTGGDMWGIVNSAGDFFLSIAGGLVGQNNGMITECYTTSTVIGGRGATSLTGGLVGHNNAGTITECYTVNTVTGGEGGSSRTGGLVGGNNVGGTITECYTASTVTGGTAIATTGLTDTGGLVGASVEGTIAACYALGSVTGGTATGATGEAFMNTGGLMGASSGSIIRTCYATGSVKGGEHNAASSERANNPYTGGLVGFNAGTSDGLIVACYSRGLVTGGIGGTVYTGGLVGGNTQTIRACYTTSEPVDGTGSGNVIFLLTGGLVGHNSGTVEHSYHDSSVSGFTRSAGFNEGTINMMIDVSAASKETHELRRHNNPYTGGYTGIYSDWNVDFDEDSNGDDPWDFGGRSQYPVLKVDFNKDNDATAAEFGGQGRVPPTNLTTMVVSHAEIMLSWTAPMSRGGTVTGYKLQWNREGETAFEQEITGIAADATSYSHMNLEKGTEYSYQLIAVSSIGESNFESNPSSESSGTTHDVPDAPTALTATAVSGTQIDLSWNAPANDGGQPITGYQLQFSEDGTSFENIEGPATNEPTTNGATTYSHSELMPGTTYSYRVAAVNSAGTSAYYPAATKPVVSGTTHDVPDAPTALTATAVSGTQIDLSWNAPASDGGQPITGYQLQFSEDGTSFENIEGPATNEPTTNGATTYSHSELMPGTTYSYRVAAINSVGTGTYHPVATEPVVSATTHNVPDAPTALTATAVSGTQIDLSWNAPASDGGQPITGYQLQFSEDGTSFENIEGPATNEPTTNGATTYSHSELMPGTTYSYRVAAINSVGTGTYHPVATEPVVSATTHNVPDAPTALTATAVSGTQIDLSWNAPASDGGQPITGYKLQWNKAGETAFGQEITGIVADATSYSHMNLEQRAEYTYRLIAINNIGESNPSNEVSINNVNVFFNVSELEEELRLYPNPTLSVVRFTNLPADRRYLYRVCSLVGQELLSGTVRSEAINVSSLTSGQYILLLNNEEGNEVLRTHFLVQK